MQQHYTNNLINETSPYLLQHAHNPVNWYPWSEEALNLAKKEDKLILVSIGYSACHWCHVMERESFENADTAAIMNEHFINIKIDREERPDLDHIYMDAVQAISGSGGWPLNVFLTPEAKPFYGGTYFPPVRAFNRMSWREVLHAVAGSWKEKRHEVEAQAYNLTEHISNAGNFSAGDKKFFNLTFNETFGSDPSDEMFNAIMKSADTTWGGFGRAPKFPQTFVINYLLQFYHYTHNDVALEQALLSIDKMIEGGIYDHVGGGMSRYSTDEEWLAPHFEKMLYDNALLLVVLCDAYQITGLKKYKNCIDKTISFLENEMLHPQGGFYTAIDADSEGEEGKFYVWSRSEIEAVLGDKAELFCSFYDITQKGNWEGKNILRILENEEIFLQKHQLDKENFDAFIGTCIQKLFERRSARKRPGLDDKIILSSNALVIKALARASAVLKNDHYAQLAMNAFEFIITQFRTKQAGEGMLHTWKNGQAKYAAFLDDYAFLIDAAIELYGVSFDERKLDAASKLCNHVLENFSDADEVLFYYTGQDQHDVIVRKKEIYDGAIPSGNAMMAHNLHRLCLIFDEQGWGSRAEKMLQSVSGAIIKYPSSFAVWASLLLTKLKGAPEIIVTGKGADLCARRIRSEYYLPGSIVMAAEKCNPGFPLFTGKSSENFFQIFICRNNTCLAPLFTIEEMAKALESR